MMMRYFNFIAFVFAFCLTSFANDRVIHSSISHVTVFRSQAQIVRDVKLDLEAGYSTWVLDQISPQLVDGSIEVKINSANLLSVSRKNDFLKPDEKPAEIIALQDSLESIENALFIISSDKESLALQKELLLANKNIGGNQTGVKAEELEDVLSVFQKKLNDIKNELLALNLHEKRLLVAKEHIAKQLEDYNSGQMNLSNQIVLQLYSDKAQSNVSVEITYLVNGVSWQPFYDIRVKDTHTPVTFMVKANIIQNTGENWKNVRLRLTTSNPLLGGNKPELSTNFIRFFEPQAYNTRMLKSAAPAMMNNVQMEDAGAAPELTTVNETDVNTEFIVNLPYSIPSDQNPHQVDLTQIQIPAVFQYAVVPSLDKDVFVTARIATQEIINSISGEANVYFDGTFTGKTYLNQTSEDSIDISLGRDRRIICDRNRLKEFSHKSFFGNTKTEESYWEISLRNSRKEAIRIVVEDHIPVSTDKEIEVLLKDRNEANYDAASGKLSWILTIPAEQSQKLHFSFDVKYPSDKRISAY